MGSMEPLIPSYVQIFVLAGIAALSVLVPLKVLYEATRSGRDRRRKAQELADRLKERLGEAVCDTGFLAPPRVKVSYEGRRATLTPEDEDELRIVLDATVSPRFPIVARTRGAVGLPWAVEGWRVLPLLKTFDPLLDGAVSVYADGAFGAYVRELALDGPAGGKPAALAESLIVLNRLPGIRAFELRMSTSGVRLRFELKSGDLLYRPDELEAALHHAFAVYDLLVLS